MCSTKSSPTQHPIGMLRRSISCSGASTYTSACHIRNDKCAAETRPTYSRHSSICPLESANQRQLINNFKNFDEELNSVNSPYGLPTEDDIAPLVHNAMSNYIDCYFRIIVLPILLVAFLAYSFTYLPEPPKAEIYKSLTATFVILMGIVVQCCFVTGWAATTLGFGDFLTLLRYAVNPRL